MRTILVLLLSFAFLFADHDDERKKHTLHLPYDMRYLDLDRTQHQEIRTLLSAYRHTLKEIHKAKERLEKERKRLFLQKHFDKSAFVNKTMKIKQQSVEADARLIEGIHNVLTPAQRRAFADHLEEWEDD